MGNSLIAVVSVHVVDAVEGSGFLGKDRRRARLRSAGVLRRQGSSRGYQKAFRGGAATSSQVVAIPLLWRGGDDRTLVFTLRLLLGSGFTFADFGLKYKCVCMSLARDEIIVGRA